MAWSDYLQFTQDLKDISDASANAMTILMEQAPDTGAFEFVAVSAPAVLTPYAQYSQDAAYGYAAAAQRSAGLVPVASRVAPVTLTPELLEPVVKWAFTGVVSNYVVGDVLPRLIGRGTRIISNVGRDSLVQEFGKSGREAVWRRVPRGNACAYCRMMSQWTYTNKDDAQRTVTRDGYWKTRAGKGRVFSPFKTPGAAMGSKRAAGSKFHDHCRCEAVCDFGDWLDVPDEVSDRWERFENQWDKAYENGSVSRFRDQQEVWERVSAGPGSLDAKKRIYRKEMAKLPNIEQRALAEIRTKYQVR